MLQRLVWVLVLLAITTASPHNQRVRKVYDDERIVGGTDAPAGKYPSLVSLLWFGSHMCGGTIVTNHWILTTASCVVDATFDVLVGTVTLNSGGTVYDVNDVILHERFNYATGENDIALVSVYPFLIWSDMIQPVKLPNQGQITPVGSNATVVGWGLPYSGGQVVNHLQEVDYFIISDQECNDVYDLQVFSTNICASYPGGGKGHCDGDGGGPLFVDDYQVGIVSWSEKPCTKPPYPGVFTEVSAYVTWIKSNTIN